MFDLPNLDQLPAAIFEEWLGALPAAGLAQAVVDLGHGPPVVRLRAWLDEFVPTPVPEPGTWLLMIGGLGVVGGVMRRRQAGDPAEPEADGAGTGEPAA